MTATPIADVVPTVLNVPVLINRRRTMIAAILHSAMPTGQPGQPGGTGATRYADAKPLVIEELERPEPRAGELGVSITY